LKENRAKIYAPGRPRSNVRNVLRKAWLRVNCIIQRFKGLVRASTIKSNVKTPDGEKKLLIKMIRTGR
jgi:hypothetical protein